VTRRPSGGHASILFSGALVERHYKLSPTGATLDRRFGLFSSRVFAGLSSGAGVVVASDGRIFVKGATDRNPSLNFGRQRIRFRRWAR